MTSKTAKPNRSDKAAFGVVYGSISVMAFLMTMHQPITNPDEQALILFGTVVVVAIAKVYAEVGDSILKLGQPHF